MTVGFRLLWRHTQHPPLKKKHYTTEYYTRGLLLWRIPLEQDSNSLDSISSVCLTVNAVGQVRALRNVTEVFVDICLCLRPIKVMSIEEVERIMDETQEAVEYQQVWRQY